MKNLSITIFFIASLLILVFQKSDVYTNSSNPPSGQTGAPGEVTCAQASCHGGTPIIVDAINPKIKLEEFQTNNLVNGYTGIQGTTINLIVQFNQSTSPIYTVYGFSMTALYEDGTTAGTFSTNQNNVSILSANGRSYAGHQNATSTNTWLVQYELPASISQDIIFYIAGNGANGNSLNSGDDIYLAEYRLTANSFGYNNGPCDAEFSYNDLSNGQYSFSPLNGVSGASYTWSFGNGDSSFIQNPVYQFATSGLYEVCLVIENNGCSNTYCEMLNVTVSNSVISFSGTITKGLNIPAQNAIVYLISADSVANDVVLSLVDSQFTSPQGFYNFSNLTTGTYYLKAGLTSNDADFAGYLPTYYDVSLFWGYASAVSSNNSNLDIALVAGNNTGGPGFVSGNISQGAGKVAGGAPIANLPILLLDVNDILCNTYTAIPMATLN